MIRSITDYYSPYYYGGSITTYYYGGLYGRNYYSPFYSSWYSPYYYGGYNSYSFNDKNSTTYGRREKPSTLSTRWSGGTSSPVASGSRRSTDIATGQVQSDRPPEQMQLSATSRRTVNPGYNSQQAVLVPRRNLPRILSKSGSENVTGTQSRRAARQQPVLSIIR